MRGSSRPTVSGVLPAILLASIASTASRAAAQEAKPFLTPAEASDYLSYSPPDSAFAWMQELASRTGAGLAVDPLATVPDGAAGAPVVLPVARMGEGRVRVLVLGSQHGDERAGYEAALRLARDLSLGELRPLLDDLDVTIVPVTNPIGMRRGVRTDASDNDPNRDHVKLESPINRALWELHAALEPHVVLDLHEMGPTPYEAQVGLPTHPNVDPQLTELGRYWLLPYVVRALAEANVRFHEYVTEVPDPAYRNELSARPDSFLTWAPISANNARNAFSLAGSLALLLETASGYEIDDLRRRTDRLVLTARSFLEVIVLQSEMVLSRTMREADHQRAATPFLALTAETVADPLMPQLRWLEWNERGLAVARSVDEWRPGVRITSALPLPAAWLIPPDETDLVAHLIRHGIQVETLLEAARIELSEYESPESLRFVERDVPAGSWLVRSNQPRQRLAFTLIEPGSDDGWVAAPPPGFVAGGARADVAEGIDPSIGIDLMRIEGTLPGLSLAVASADDLLEPAGIPNE